VDLAGTQTINGTKTFSASTQTLGNGTGTGTINVGTGATISGATKAVNIGTNSVAGSTTNISIGSGFGTSTTVLNGSTVGVTLAVDSNGSGLATTAFVVGQAGSATPLVNGTAAVGTSLRYARQDHVHGTDTSRAALASPTFTGVPAAPTAAVDTNTTQLATTAYVVAQAASATPLVNGTAAVGTSLRYARADHVHPTDTTRAALNSPTFTGTPSLPTGTTAVTQTAGNNTTALATTAFVQQEVPTASTTVAGKVELATNAETITSNSVSVVPALDVIPAIITRPENRSLNYINSTAVSGSGSASPNTAGLREIFLSSLSAGRSAYWLGVPGFNQTACLMSRANNQLIDFSKKIWVSGKSCAGFNIATNYMGDSNTMCRVTLGGYNANGTGDMVQKGIGWKKVGGTSPFFTLTVHNGTTLTDVATTVQQSDKKVIDWVIYSDGTGNVTLYIDGAQAATTSAGPIGTSTAGYSMYREQVEATATPTVRGILHSTGGHIYTEG
jgi:hypothetical protein